MKKEYFKLGSIKSLLTNEEMKKIAGGYDVCCCVGDGCCCPNPWCSTIYNNGCETTCMNDCNTTNGALWTGSSICNYCTSETCCGGGL